MPKQTNPGYFFAYRESLKFLEHDYPFYSFIMAAMRKADTTNLEILKQGWPEVWTAFKVRYYAPGGAVTQPELDYLVPRVEG